MIIKDGNGEREREEGWGMASLMLSLDFWRMRHVCALAIIA
jgi:hypothetical protein